MLYLSLENLQEQSFDRLGGLWPDRIFGGFHRRIEALEFDPGHLVSELPVDFGLELVAWPSQARFPRAGVDRRNAAI